MRSNALKENAKKTELLATFAKEKPMTSQALLAKRKANKQENAQEKEDEFDGPCVRFFFFLGAPKETKIFEN